MPSKSAKQARFMRAVANSPEFAKKVGVSQKVGKEFEAADRRSVSRAEGGQVMMNRMKMRGSAGHSADTAKAPTGYAKGGYAKGGSASKRADGCATKGKTKGTMVAMAKGGKAMAKGGKAMHKMARGGKTC
jgi:hypothetical protein